MLVDYQRFVLTIWHIILHLTYRHVIVNRLFSDNLPRKCASECLTLLTGKLSFFSPKRSYIKSDKVSAETKTIFPPNVKTVHSGISASFMDLIHKVDLDAIHKGPRPRSLGAPCISAWFLTDTWIHILWWTVQLLSYQVVCSGLLLYWNFFVWTIKHELEDKKHEKAP